MASYESGETSLIEAYVFKEDQKILQVLYDLEGKQK